MSFKRNIWLPAIDFHGIASCVTHFNVRKRLHQFNSRVSNLSKVGNPLLPMHQSGMSCIFNTVYEIYLSRYTALCANWL